mmetsp:Transcript_39015/g.59380  ORF Transcript_39015/g.59380 Transcript_39015/m.59380 type:complete len:96 (-) Transcript_39015:1270-1557(-)
MSLDAVVKLMQTINQSRRADTVSMKDFIKIFERDTYGDKATEVIKKECVTKKQAEMKKVMATIIRNRNHSKSGDSDGKSMFSMGPVSSSYKRPSA